MSKQTLQLQPMLDKILEDANQNNKTPQNVVCLDDIPAIADTFFFPGVDHVLVTSHGMQIGMHNANTSGRDDFILNLLMCVGMEWHVINLECTAILADGNSFSGALLGRKPPLLE